MAETIPDHWKLPRIKELTETKSGDHLAATIAITTTMARITGFVRLI